MTSISWVLGICILFIVLGLIPGPITPMMAPCALAHSFNLKTGAWEMTPTSVITGTLIPPDVLAKLPPERRARLEQAMQARSGQPKTEPRGAALPKGTLIRTA